MNGKVQVSSLINAEPSEIYFTRGGTESDNLALKGIALKNRKKGRHIITSSFEHPAVLEVCKTLTRLDYDVTYLPVTREGLVEPDAVRAAIRPDTILISIMHANNEIGTIQPLHEIGQIAREKMIYFHSDGVQTAGKIPVDVKALCLDALSISRHESTAQRALKLSFARTQDRVQQQDGGHEGGLRSEQRNVPA